MNILTPLSSTALPLRANFSWTLLGNLVYAACQWGILIILAKLGTPALVGQFSLGLAVTAPVLMLTNLQLRAVQATDANHEYRFGLYLWLRLLCTLLALLLIGGLVMWSGYPRETAFVILLVGVAKGFEAVSDLFYGLLQQAERMDKIAISLLLKGPLSLLVMGAVIYGTGNLVWSVAAMALTWGLLLFTYDLPAGQWVLAVGRQSTLRTELHATRQAWHTLGHLAWLAAPLGVVMMLISLNTNLPRLFLQRYAGDYALGIFSALVFLIVTGATIVQALGQAVAPRLARHYARGERAAYVRLLTYLVALGIGLALGAVGVALLGGEMLLSMVYAPAYAQQADLFVLVMIAGGLQYIASLLGYTMTAARYFRVQLLLFLAVTLATVVACLLWVPTYGMGGAVWALLLAATVQLLGCFVINLYALRQMPVVT